MQRGEWVASSEISVAGQVDFYPTDLTPNNTDRRPLLADKPARTTYNSGGTTVSLAELAGLVREFLPDAEITFDADTGGRDISGNYMINNRRLIEEFGLQYAPLRQRVKEVINDIRREEGLPPVA